MKGLIITTFETYASFLKRIQSDKMYYGRYKKKNEDRRSKAH